MGQRGRKPRVCRSFVIETSSLSDTQQGVARKGGMKFVEKD